MKIQNRGKNSCIKHNFFLLSQIVFAFMIYQNIKQGKSFWFFKHNIFFLLADNVFAMVYQNLRQEQ